MSLIKVLIGYLVVGALWSVFAGRMQFKSGLSTRMDLQFWLAIALNLFLWPLAAFLYWLSDNEDRYH